MYHTPKERMDIGRRVFAHELSKEDAAREYEVSVQSIVNYVKDYMKESRIPVVPEAADTIGIQTPNYSEMTKDQLIPLSLRVDRNSFHECALLASARIAGGFKLS